MLSKLVLLKSLFMLWIENLRILNRKYKQAHQFNFWVDIILEHKYKTIIYFLYILFYFTFCF